MLYSVATVASLWPVRRVRMPDWLAAFDLAVSIVLPLLVTSQLDPDADNGYATWYVAAVGTLMTIAAARRQLAAAWLGVIALAVQSVVWAGPLSLGALGVIGSIVWVAIAHMLTAALTTAARETRRYAQAEREAADWQAAQDAHLYEGQMRLAQTNRIAAPMLRRDRRPRRRPHRRPAAGVPHARGAPSATRSAAGCCSPTPSAPRCSAPASAASIVTLLDEGGIDDLDEPTQRPGAVAARRGGRGARAPTGSSPARRRRAGPSR